MVKPVESLLLETRALYEAIYGLNRAEIEQAIAVINRLTAGFNQAI
jgi:hypothetical protein